MSTNEVVSTGESDLLTLIAQMSPSLDDQVWAFVSVGEVSSKYLAEHALATFREGLMEADFSSLEGIVSLFQKATAESAAAGWLHYLAFDFWVGVWIVKHSRKLGISHKIVVFGRAAEADGGDRLRATVVDARRHGVVHGGQGLRLPARAAAREEPTGEGGGAQAAGEGQQFASVDAYHCS